MAHERTATPRDNTRRRLLELASFTACLIVASLGAKANAQPLTDGNSSRESMAEAQQAIPFDRLTEATQGRIWNVVSSASIYRRLPSQRIECDPDLFVFMVRKPEVIVNIWQVMGASQISAQRTGEYTLQTSDGAGTHSAVDLVYGSRDLHLIFADGYYEGALLKKKTVGKCVLLLRSRHDQTPEGRPFVDVSLDVFVKIESPGAELLARTLYPLVGGAADVNFTETVKFISKLSQAAETNGPGVQRLALRLENVDALTRQQFCQVTAMVGQRVAARAQEPEPQERNHVGEMPRPFTTSDADSRPLPPASFPSEAAADAEPIEVALGTEITPKRALLLRR